MSAMLLPMIDTNGRRRIAELTRAAMGWEGLSGPSIEATGRVSRATIDRIKRGDPRVSDTMLRALGDVLRFPRDFLIYLGEGNVVALQECGADPDLLRWTMALFSEDDPQEGDSRTNVR